MPILVCRKTFIVPAILAAVVGLFLHDYHSLDFTSGLVRGKRVLVTGASRGIGRHVALHYARLGAKVVITGRDEEAVKRVRDECELAAREAIASTSPSSSAEDSAAVFYLVADLEGTSLSSAEDLVSSAVGLLGGGLDVLFLNHAVSTLGFWTGSPENVTSAARAVDVNYLSFVALVSAAKRHLEASGGGVTAVSSATARWPMPSVSHYGASKAAMDSFFRSLDLEFRLRRVDVAVTVCVLGLVKTRRYIDNMAAFNPNGASSVAFYLGADPSEAALFMIKAGTLRKPHVRFPFSQFILGDLMEFLPAPLKLMAMKKTLPMISD